MPTGLNKSTGSHAAQPSAQIPLKPWKTVRVFISSTFRDMHAERDHLVKVVFPALRERLLKYRVHLVDIDLRWGVTQEQSDNDLALEFCLEQVEECRPFFIGMLGERYGYTPSRLPERTITKYPWLEDLTDKSVTELEIMAAMQSEPNVHAQALFFFRDPAFIKDVPAAKRVDVEAESPGATDQLTQLKNFIRNFPPTEALIESYPCTYRGLRVNARLIQKELSQRAWQVFKKSLQDGIVDPSKYAQLNKRLIDAVHRHGSVYTGGAL